MIIDTEEIRNKIMDHFNAEIEKSQNSTFPHDLYIIAQNNFQDCKSMALKEIDKFEIFITKMSDLTGIILKTID